MNIVFLTRLYYPHIGGVERHVRGLVKELGKDNQITIITEKYSVELADEEIIDGVTILRIPVVGVGESAKKWVIWKWLSRHPEFLDSADIIHVHDIMFWLYPYKLLHPAKKIFITFHGWEGIFPLPIKNILHKRFDNFLSSGNICVGDFIGKWYGFPPDYITYGAVDHFAGNTTVTRHKNKILLFLGRLDHDTGFEQCLDIYSRLKNKLHWQLQVAGDGPHKSLLPPDAGFLGFVAHPEAVINRADYIFSTGYLGILESWSQRKLVLSGYTHALKKDYLLMHPLSRYLVLDGNIPPRLPEEAYNWACAQTWSKLAGLYRELWSK